MCRSKVMLGLSMVCLVGCAATADPDPSGAGELGTGGKSDALGCDPGITVVDTIPEQTPPSRLGTYLPDYLPADRSPIETRQADGSTYELYDTDDDGEADLHVKSEESGAYDYAHWYYPNGDGLILWTNDAGYVDWEQRYTADGDFENSFDRDDDGNIDDLRMGEAHCLTVSYRLRGVWGW